MKIAYLMVVHRNPKLLKRVIGMLSSGDSAFFIHVDRKTDIREFAAISGEDVFFCEQRVAVHWGEFSQVEATMRLLRQALASSANYDYFAFLQGSDYPLRSGRYVQRFLEENRGWEFINLVQMPAPGYSLSKINKLRYASDKPVRRFAARALAKIGLAYRNYENYLKGLQAYAGQAWWTLSREACSYIVDFSTRNPTLEKYFRNTFTADEMFFHTILGNSPFRSRLRRCLVFVDPDWSIADDRRHRVSDKHLRVFESQEKVWVEDEWGSGEVLFARKFSDDNLGLIDRIDEMIRRKEGQAANSLASVNA